MAILLAAAEGTANSGGWAWKDLLTLAGVLITGVVSVYTIKLSRRTTLDTSESNAYQRADKINENAIARLEREVASLRQEAERREERHQKELEQRDARIDDLEDRLGRSERRVDQLVQVIRDGNLPVPPPQA